MKKYMIMAPLVLAMSLTAGCANAGGQQIVLGANTPRAPLSGQDQFEESGMGKVL